MIKKLSRCVIYASMVVAFVAPAKSSYSAEHATGIYAFYCPSKEIAFIGELMPPVLSTVENDKVRAELGLSDSQIGKMRETEKAFLAGIKNVLGHDENKEREEMGSARRARDNIIAIGKFSEDARKRTNEILKPHQLSRMQEILLQRYGLLSIPKKDLRQLMRLDAKQEREIDEIRSDVFKRMDETVAPDSVVALPDGCKFAGATSRDFFVFLRESEKAVQRLLSPEQNNIFEKIRGEKFSY